MFTVCGGATTRQPRPSVCDHEFGPLSAVIQINQSVGLLFNKDDDKQVQITVLDGSDYFSLNTEP